MAHRELTSNRETDQQVSSVRRSAGATWYAWSREDDAAAGLIGVRLSWMAGFQRLAPSSRRCKIPAPDGRRGVADAHPCREARCGNGSPAAAQCGVSGKACDAIEETSVFHGRSARLLPYLNHHRFAASKLGSDDHETTEDTTRTD